ncbi:hypothetical protein [Shimia ponticola]|uniref:hypothetical protein n=1 Tax=Shimia ponticola TaxID=2582893 RepID=UPI0011BEE60D|nr:hypothetical protein [Shimia ponticola]
MTQSHEICIIACFYNPTGSKVRLANFKDFYRPLKREGIPVYVIEQVIDGAPSALEGIVENLKIVRSGSILWQKERLLNRLISMLPEQFTKVVWSDVDMLFGKSPSVWLEAMSKKLDEFQVVHGFSSVNRQPKYWLPFQKKDCVCSMAKVFDEWDHSVPFSDDYPTHGHTGYTWGARRSFLEECGLYDTCMSGSGDHLMAHAFCNDLETGCFDQVFQDNEAYRDHYLLWAERAAALTGGRMGYVDCELEHLWHGSPRNRKYRKRDKELISMRFDPAEDLVLTDDGTWNWGPKGQRFVPWAKEYFRARKER